MARRNVVELQNSRSEILEQAEYRGERIIIHRGGRAVAALVPLEDLELLERLLEEAEDRLDVETARAALAESDERIPYTTIRERLGLDDGRGTKRA